MCRPLTLAEYASYKNTPLQPWSRLTKSMVILKQLHPDKIRNRLHYNWGVLRKTQGKKKIIYRWNNHALGQRGMLNGTKCYEMSTCLTISIISITATSCSALFDTPWDKYLRQWRGGCFFIIIFLLLFFIFPLRVNADWPSFKHGCWRNKISLFSLCIVSCRVTHSGCPYINHFIGWWQGCHVENEGCR